jgi:glutathione synthetase
MSILVREAIDFAIVNGLLKYNAHYELTHAPLCLTPFPITQRILDQIHNLTPVLNALWLKIANTPLFLKAELEKTARADRFIANLLALLPDNDGTATRQLLISRNDVLLVDTADSASLLAPKQVEFNTISNSFLSLSKQIARLHQHLHDWGLLEQAPLSNDPLEAAVDLMATAIHGYGHPKACLLMIVQDPEQNIFDQRAIEFRLLEKYGYPTLRMTLDEIFQSASLHEGHLKIKGRTAALSYFRAGYTPNDYPGEIQWKARALIEHSSSIKCPSVGMQLSGAKKIQQLLGHTEILREFVDAESAEKIRDTFVGLYTLDDLIEGLPAREAAIKSPDRYVLKPQREGGGNNLYGQEMIDKLQSLTEADRHAYILMERIPSTITPARLVVESTCEERPSISEIGRYGVCLADGDSLVENRDIGYLVRTKSADLDEGGVCAGYACLNSLCLHP